MKIQATTSLSVILLMNALFELQEILLPKQWLQVKAMEIQIFRLVPSNVNLLIMEDTSLREYYLDWNNYDTSENVVRELLEAFWSSYKSYIGLNVNLMHKGHALRVFELDESATKGHPQTMAPFSAEMAPR